MKINEYIKTVANLYHVVCILLRKLSVSDGIILH